MEPEPKAAESTESAEPQEPKPEYSDSESSDEEDERELQGRTYSDKGVEVNTLLYNMFVGKKQRKKIHRHGLQSLK